jgi:beta-galactosidase
MKHLFLAICLTFSLICMADARFSTAGFFQVEGSERSVYSLNPSWRLHVGAIDFKQTTDATNNNSIAVASNNNPTTDATTVITSRLKPYSVDYNDSAWQAVNLPNGIELLPFEASAGINYRGEVWYRKWVELPSALSNKRMLLHFEAIMGKSKIYINGNLVHEHFGGFTPIVIDVTDHLKSAQKNLLAVWADNSDDPMYPPGKTQSTLDFTYFGGIYRDVWLVGTSKRMYVTDEINAKKTAGGGFLFGTISANQQQAIVEIKLDIDGTHPTGRAELEFYNADNTLAYSQRIRVRRGENKVRMTLNQPRLWSPDRPHLYNLHIKLTDTRGNTQDEFIQKVGIRHLRFSFSLGLVLNGEPYGRKLVGGNRHQDFAVVGYALSNSLHWRDAEKLKSVGMDLIRNAHYPQDPAFMDACDALGLFVIENIPGWQFWNEDPVFVNRVYSDIEQMVRRDRSRPSVIMWEPVLNETRYPVEFAKNVHDLIKKEMPYEGSNYTASDAIGRGSEHFDVLFTHPEFGLDKELWADGSDGDTLQVYFSREWGDNVEDWGSQNSPSRVAREWGEVPQLVQAFHYGAPDYTYVSYDTFPNLPARHLGAALWHSFDHQRGYHPDPFYGGIMDAFRREKYSSAMFRGQSTTIAPMVFIANELTPFSPRDITVFSNCDQVRLTTFFGPDSITTLTKEEAGRWFTFTSAWHFMEDKRLSRSGRQDQVYIKAEGLNKQGEVIATHIKKPARRPSQILLFVDTLSVTPVANGGDLVVITAAMADRHGTIKRLNNTFIHFTIEGEGELVADEKSMTNPVQLSWGEASVLVRTTTQSGTIRITATPLFTGDHTIKPTTIEIKSRQGSRGLGV